MIWSIAEAGSVSKAASALGLAQPALTTQLQRIERAGGGAPFLRASRAPPPPPLRPPAGDGLQDEVTALVGADRIGRYRIGATNGPVAAGLVQRLSATRPASPV